MAERDIDTADIKPIESMPSCFICTNICTDPIALPCIHTFCMKCLQGTALNSNKDVGDEMSCPICRRIFKIPPEGFHGLPKNFLIERLVQVANQSYLSASSMPTCDGCVEEIEEARKEVPTADTYCVDCNQKFCQECCRHHRKFKQTRNHNMVPINEHEGGQNVTRDQVPYVCELHEHNILNIYCTDCKTVVCAICFIDDHKNHDGSHVDKFMDDFRKQIGDNTEATNECRSKVEMKKAELFQVKGDIHEKVENLESDIGTRKGEMKQLADEHATLLLQGLYLIRQSRLKGIETKTSDIDAYLSSLETYRSYCEEMMVTESACDICRAFSDLSVRAVELQEQCQLLIEKEIQSFNICFQKSELEEFLQENCQNLIGKIEEDGGSQLKKRIKESLLQQNDEIDRMRKEISSEIAIRESLRLAIAQLRINVSKEERANKALKEELIIKDAHIKRLRDRLGNNTKKSKLLECANVDVTCTKLQAENDKLKEELDEMIKANSSLQSDNKKVNQALSEEKSANNSHQAENNKLKKELDVKIMTNNSLQSYNKKVNEELSIEKSANNALQTQNNKMRQKLCVHVMTISSLQTNNNKIKEEFDNLEKIANNSLQAENDKLKKELFIKIMMNISLKSNYEKVKWELDKEKFVSTSLQAENDNLKHELVEGKMANNFVQASDSGICKEYSIVHKMPIRASEEDVKTLELELETKQSVHFPYKSDPVLIQMITTKATEEKRKTINGLAILDKELFVVSQDLSEVEVYDLMRLSFNRRWNLKELISPFEIGSCNRNKCLYIFDHKGDGQSKEILRVDPQGNLITNWSTGDAWGWGLSVTSESNVILTVYNKQKLNEYSPDGQLIREVDLSSAAGICHPWHAIKLTNGHFVVGLGRYSDDLHRVCIVDADGKLVKSVHICGEREMNLPFYLTLAGTGSVMVADLGNSRVLLFDSDLQFEGEILSKEKHGLQRPWRILLNESSGRLFVADNESHVQGILVFYFK